MSMKRDNTLRLAIISAAIGTSFAASPSAHAAQYDLQIGCVESPSGSNTRGWQVFEQYVESHTDKVSVEIRPSGQLGSTVELLEGVKVGLHKMAQGDSTITSAYEPMKAWFIPYLFDDELSMKRFFESDTFSRLNEKMAEEFGVRALAATPYGFYNFINKKRPVTDLKSLQGLKLRTLPNSQATIKTWEALGAAATPVSWGEIYTSIKTGVIDGLGHTMGIIEDQKYYEVAKYVTRDRSFGVANLYLVNEQFYQSLPNKLQSILKKGAKLGADVEFGLASYSNNVQAVQTLEKNGVKINNLSTEKREKFKQRAQQVMIPWAKKHAGAKTVDSVLSTVKRIQNPE